MQSFLSNWNFMRLFRAGLAGWAVYMAFAEGAWMMLIPGGILGLQAWLNVGCCGTGGCMPGYDYRPDNRQQLEEVAVEAEEIR